MSPHEVLRAEILDVCTKEVANEGPGYIFRLWLRVLRERARLFLTSMYGDHDAEDWSGF